MNLEELRQIQIEERTRGDLQPLLRSFYKDVAEYIKDLQIEREDVLKNPVQGSNKVNRRLEDEIKSVKEVVEIIYGRRVGKMLKVASLAAVGLRDEDISMSEEEEILFKNLVRLLRENRNVILKITSGDGMDDNIESVIDTDAIDPQKKNIGGNNKNTLNDGMASDLSRIELKMIQGVGEIYGVDGETYNLDEGDIVSLPEENAKILIDAKVAKIIENRK
jgi:DNA replication initiation complex subunit (GINS family)